MSGETRLLIVDDHSLFREGLVRLLAAEPGFQIVRSCAHVKEALEALDKEQVDLVLLDFDLGAEQSTQLLSTLKSEIRRPRVLMVTAGMSSAAMLQVIEAGASGIFLKRSPPGQLAEAIRIVMEGEMWLDPRAVRPVIDAMQRVKRRHNAPSLSERERAVLKGVLEGESNKTIGAALHLSESSVKAALQQLFGKTGVRTRSQLVRLAIEHHSHDWLAEDAE